MLLGTNPALTHISTYLEALRQKEKKKKSNVTRLSKVRARRATVTTLISEKLELRAESITRQKEGFFIMIKH